MVRGTKHQLDGAGMETRLITIASMKGGVGKSTHAVALASALLDRNHSVRLLETDEQGSAGAWADDVSEHHDRLDTAYLEIANTDFNIAHDKILEKCDGPEYIILDTPGVSNSASLAALYTADVVISPFMLSDWDINGLETTKALHSGVFRQFNEEIPDNFFAFFMRGNSFMSNSEKETLEALSTKMPVRAGLVQNANIKKWTSNGRTIGQLRDGVPRVEGSEPMTNAAIDKAAGYIDAFANEVEGIFNA